MVTRAGPSASTAPASLLSAEQESQGKLDQVQRCQQVSLESRLKALYGWRWRSGWGRHQWAEVFQGTWTNKRNQRKQTLLILTRQGGDLHSSRTCEVGLNLDPPALGHTQVSLTRDSKATIRKTKMSRSFNLNPELHSRTVTGISEHPVLSTQILYLEYIESVGVNNLGNL